MSSSVVSIDSSVKACIDSCTAATAVVASFRAPPHINMMTMLCCCSFICSGYSCIAATAAVSTAVYSCCDDTFAVQQYWRAYFRALSAVYQQCCAAVLLFVLVVSPSGAQPAPLAQPNALSPGSPSSLSHGTFVSSFARQCLWAPIGPRCTSGGALVSYCCSRNAT